MSMRQDTKRNNICSGPQLFNVNESDPPHSCKRTTSGRAIDDNIQPTTIQLNTWIHDTGR